MKVDPEYNVRLGGVARTIFYEDTQGSICFTFDVETVNGQATIILERGPETTVESERLRRNMASDKITQYLIGCGYKVSYYDG